MGGIRFGRTPVASLERRWTRRNQFLEDSLLGRTLASRGPMFREDSCLRRTPALRTLAQTAARKGKKRKKKEEEGGQKAKNTSVEAKQIETLLYLRVQAVAMLTHNLWIEVK